MACRALRGNLVFESPLCGTISKRRRKFLDKFATKANFAYRKVKCSEKGEGCKRMTIRSFSYILTAQSRRSKKRTPEVRRLLLQHCLQHSDQSGGRGGKRQRYLPVRRERHAAPASSGAGGISGENHPNLSIDRWRKHRALQAGRGADRACTGGTAGMRSAGRESVGSGHPEGNSGKPEPISRHAEGGGWSGACSSAATGIWIPSLRNCGKVRLYGQQGQIHVVPYLQKRLLCS